MSSGTRDVEVTEKIFSDQYQNQEVIPYKQAKMLKALICTVGITKIYYF